MQGKGVSFDAEPETFVPTIPTVKVPFSITDMISPNLFRGGQKKEVDPFFIPGVRAPVWFLLITAHALRHPFIAYPLDDPYSLTQLALPSRRILLPAAVRGQQRQPASHLWRIPPRGELQALKGRF